MRQIPSGGVQGQARPQGQVNLHTFNYMYVGIYSNDDKNSFDYNIVDRVSSRRGIHFAKANCNLQLHIVIFLRKMHSFQHKIPGFSREHH